MMTLHLYWSFALGLDRVKDLIYCPVPHGPRAGVVLLNRNVRHSRSRILFW